MATKPTTNTIDFVAAAVDRLGAIKAQLADLKAEEARLAGIITEAGVEACEGDLFRATVSTVAERHSLDAKAAEAKLRELGVDGRWFSKHQKVAKSYVSVRVTARKP